jgi:preprotein translocase subunit YajC
MSAAVQFTVIVIALLGFWFIVLRPTRTSQRRVAELQHQLGVGDEVIISAGIFGTIRSIDDDRVQLEIAPGTVITVARQVVVRRAPEPASDPTSDTTEE